MCDLNLVIVSLETLCESELLRLCLRKPLDIVTRFWDVIEIQAPVQRI